MEMIAIVAAGLLGSLGALICLVAWHRGGNLPPVIAVATVGLPALVGLLAAQMALSRAEVAAESPALAAVAPHLAVALVSRELAFFAALVPALCLAGGSALLTLRAGRVRAKTWALACLVLSPVVVLPLVHGVVHHSLAFGVIRAAAYLALAVTAAAAILAKDESRVAVPVAVALVIAIGEAAALAASAILLLQDIGQMGAVSRGALDLAVQDITGGMIWLTLTAAWAGVAAILAVVRTAGEGPVRARAVVALLWLAPVPLAFLAGDVTELLMTVI